MTLDLFSFLHSKRFWLALGLGVIWLVWYARCVGGGVVLVRKVGANLKKLLATKSFAFGLGLGVLGFTLGFAYGETWTNGWRSVFYSPTENTEFTPFGFGILFAAAAVSGFAFLRLLLPNVLSAVGALLYVTSPISLYVLIASPQRDFMRAPWLLTIFALLGNLLKPSVKLSHYYGMAATMGVCFGIGQRVREEIPLLFIPALFSVIAFSDRVLRERLIAAGLLLVTAGSLVGRPIFRFFPEQSGMAYTRDVQELVGLNETDYDVAHYFIDEHSRANAALAMSDPSALSTEFSRFVVSTFPADIIVRFYSAFRQIIRAPLLTQRTPQGLETSVIGRWWDLRRSVQQLFLGTEFVFILILMGGVLYVSWRRGLCLLTWVGGLSALVSIQFFQRTYSYMEVLVWGALLAVPYYAFRMAPHWREIRFKINAKLGFACFPLVVLIAGYLMVLGLRDFQEQKIEQLIEYYDTLSTKELTQVQPIRGGIELLAGPIDPGKAEFYKLEFRACPGRVVYPMIRYRIHEPAEARLDWSRRLIVNLDEARTVYFPAWDRFSGVELSSRDHSCLRRFSKIDVPVTKMRMTVITPLKRSFKEPMPHGYRASKAGFSSLEDIHASEVVMMAPGMEENHEGWEFNGFGIFPVDAHFTLSLDRSRSKLASSWLGGAGAGRIDTDILIAEEKHLEPGEGVKLSGYLKHGGLSVGMSLDGQPVALHTFTQDGPFEIVMIAPEAGEYQFGMAHRLQWYNVPENRFTLNTLAWMLRP